MRILLLSYYFPPDLSAGSFRAKALVDELAKRLPPDAYIDLITTQPNRYESHEATAPSLEEDGRLTIRRVPVPAHKSGVLGQSRAFLAYARGVRRLIGVLEYQLVVGTSSRLMTAVLSAYAAEKAQAMLYLDIRDLFLDTVKDVFPAFVSAPATMVLGLVERWTVSRASKVNLISEGFCQYFATKYPACMYSCFSNCVDKQMSGFADDVVPTANQVVGRPLRVLYAGNIGEGQGLEKIVVQLAMRFNGKLEFHIVGDGGRKRKLESQVAAAHCANVFLHPAVDRKDLKKKYLDADVLFLHLNTHAAFEKVLPSKIFEYAAIGKPIWAGVSGYAASFIRAEVPNSAVFPPSNIAQAVEVFDQLDLRTLPRESFQNKFSCDRIVGRLAEDILATARGGIFPPH